MLSAPATGFVATSRVDHGVATNERCPRDDHLMLSPRLLSSAWSN
jgi:hypothetical protein